jgi:hypothetical protein
MHTICKVARKFLQRYCIDRSQNKRCISLCPSWCLLCPQFLHRHCIEKTGLINPCVCLCWLLLFWTGAQGASLGTRRMATSFQTSCISNRGTFNSTTWLLDFTTVHRAHVWKKTIPLATHTNSICSFIFSSQKGHGTKSDSLLCKWQTFKIAVFGGSRMCAQIPIMKSSCVGDGDATENIASCWTHLHIWVRWRREHLQWQFFITTWCIGVQ